MALEGGAGPGAVRLPGTPLVEVSADGGELLALPHAGIPFSAEVRRRHILGIGKSGSGKTALFSNGFFVSLLSMTPDSVVVNNLKGPRATEAMREMVAQVAPGTEFIVFAPGNAARSAACNFLEVARRHDLLDALKALLAAVVTNGRSGTNFFSQTTRLMLDALLPLDGIDGLAHLHELLKNPALLQAVAQRVRSAELNGLLTYHNSHNGETSRMNDAGCLEPFAHSPAIRAVCSGPDELDPIELLRSGRRFVLVLEADDASHEQDGVAINFLFELLRRGILRACDSNAGRLPRPMSFLLDEAGSFYLQGLPVSVNLVRERGVSIICLVQSIAQLEALYGYQFGSLIGGFGTHIYFCGHLSESDAKSASRDSGSIWVKDSVDITDGFAGIGDARSRSYHNRERPLLKDDDLRSTWSHPVFGKPIVVMGSGRQPLLAHITPSWEIPAIASALEAGAANAGRMRDVPLPPVPAAGLIDPSRFKGPHPALTIGDRAMTRAELVQMISGLRGPLQWPAPRTNPTGPLRWGERYELGAPVEKVYVLMRKLEVREATLSELEDALARCGSGEADDGIVQLDLDDINAGSVRRRGSRADGGNGDGGLGNGGAAGGGDSDDRS
ncbi:MAG: type IV secretory system conjugative DNA transfer family protein, partial [bacterium]